MKVNLNMEVPEGCFGNKTQFNIWAITESL